MPDIRVGEWYQHTQHGQVYVKKFNVVSWKALIVNDPENESTSAWVSADELSDLFPSQSLPPSTTPPSSKLPRPTPRPRARTTCTFEVTFPLPPTATQSQAKEFVKSAMANADFSKMFPDDPMNGLEVDKIRVKLVRKTTFY